MSDAVSGRDAAYEVGHVDLQRVALLTNPHAGKGRAGLAAEIARGRFADHGIDVLTIQGADPEGARDLARQMVEDPEVDALVVCGGDGLINLALQEQAGSGVPLGIIPAGTGNDHAREYGIPLDPERAAETIAVGRYRTTDLGLMRGPGVDGHWFGTIAMAGFDSLVTERTNQISWPTGKMRYVAVLKRLSRRRAAVKFPKIFTGEFLNEEGVSTFRASHIALRMDGVTAFADGDPVGPADITVECVPGAGSYIIP